MPVDTLKENESGEKGPSGSRSHENFDDELDHEAGRDHRALSEVRELERMHAQPSPEQAMAEQLESDKNMQRRSRTEERKDQLKGMVKQKAKDAAKKAIKKQAEKLAVRTGLRVFLVYAAPVIGVILLIFAVLGMLMMLFMYTCNSDGVTGSVVRFTSSVAHFIGISDEDYCSAMALDPATDAFNDLAANTNRRGGGGSQVTYNLDIVLTSAYRPGSVVDGDPNRPSAHGRGEAFDVSLRNPAVGFHQADPRVQQLIDIGSELGFNEPRGNVVDEYNFPSAGTTGPHIHIEFNSAQCAPGPRNPPHDLVPIPSYIPMSGVSNPQVRACMLPKLLDFFMLAGSADQDT